MTLDTEVHFGLAPVFLSIDCDEAVPDNLVLAFFSITLLARLHLEECFRLQPKSLFCCSGIFIVSSEEFLYLTTSSTTTGPVSTMDIHSTLARDFNSAGDDTLPRILKVFLLQKTFDVFSIGESADSLTAGEGTSSLSVLSNNSNKLTLDGDRVSFDEEDISIPVDCE
uniref:Uncharacterized protein n=1 Tax=Glossina pallidipes TaxID=7398 RepID=A0A1B0A5J8_GLOPL